MHIPWQSGKTTSRKSGAGFSLVEMMVVLAIIGVLASMALGPLNNLRVLAFQTAVKTDLHALDLMLASYDANFHSFPLPPQGTLPGGQCGFDGCYWYNLCNVQANGTLACSNTPWINMPGSTNWTLNLGFQPDVRHSAFALDDTNPFKVNYIVALSPDGSGWAATGAKLFTNAGYSKCRAMNGSFTTLRVNASHSICFVYNPLAPSTAYSGTQQLSGSLGNKVGSCGMTGNFDVTGPVAVEFLTLFLCGNQTSIPVVFNPLTDLP